MTPIKDTDYLAVSAWLHAMENRLLTPEKQERLLEAANEAEARKLLAECGYAENSPLEEALREHRETLYKELAAAVPEPRLIELFQLKYDYHNIKAILKAERRGISPEGLLLSGGRYDAERMQNEWHQEHRLTASDAARDAAEKAAALLRENELGVQYIKFGMSESDVSYLMADELCMFGSDALYVPGMKVTHPRSIGTFPCVLRRAVREEQSISLPEAVRKLTSMPAEVYGLAGKGRIAAGMDADLTLFDAAKITDHATYTQPLLPNEGIRRVYLGGVCAVRDGQYTGAMAGKLLRRTR